MCGRYTLKTPAPKLIELFHTPQFPDLTPRYNIAPTQRVLVIRIDPENKRQALLARWGLIPFWAKDVSIGARMINARSETVSEKPAFRQAWKKRRCLIPADGFFEWETVAQRRKQPWLIHMNDELPFAMAGWIRPASGRNRPPEDGWGRHPLRFQRSARSFLTRRHCR